MWYGFSNATLCGSNASAVERCLRAISVKEAVSGRAFPFSPVLRSDVTAPRIRTRPWYQTTRALGDRCAPFELRIPSGKERMYADVPDPNTSSAAQRRVYVVRKSRSSLVQPNYRGYPRPRATAPRPGTAPVCGLKR